MKKSPAIIPMILLLIAAGLLYAFSGTDPANTAESTDTAQINRTATSTPIEGAWSLVWGKYGDNVRNPGKPYQLKLFTEKHFSLLHEQAPGQWRGVSGTYVLEDNLYKETYLYSTNPDFVGYTAWWTYEIKNDTLWMSGPVKILNKDGKDEPDTGGGYNRMKEARVRAE